MLVDSSVFGDIGQFDEGYRVAGYEDIDFCLRAKEKMYQIYYTPAAELVHRESTTQNMFNAEFRKNNTIIEILGFRLIEFNRNVNEESV